MDVAIGTELPMTEQPPHSTNVSSPGFYNNFGQDVAFKADALAENF